MTNKSPKHLSPRRPSRKEDAAVKTTKVNTGKPLLLITIVNRQKAEFFEDLIQNFEVNFQLSLQGRGTATEQMLSLLGLERNEKTVILSVIKEERAKDALAAIEEKFQTVKNGGGIAYTVPLASIIGVAIYGFLCNNEKTVKGEASAAYPKEGEDNE